MVLGIGSAVKVEKVESRVWSLGKGRAEQLEGLLRRHLGEEGVVIEVVDAGLFDAVQVRFPSEARTFTYHSTELTSLC